MGYLLQAIIAPAAALRAATVPGSRVVTLQGGVSMIPIGRECRAILNIPTFPQLFLDAGAAPSLEGPIRDICERLSKATRLIYVEAGFHGGPPGIQAFVPFESGELAGEVVTSEEYGPISEGLRFLGVKSGAAVDEFEHVGLDRFRDTDKWLGADDT